MLSSLFAPSPGDGMEIKMKRAVYAGTFDPVTLGHLDIIRRSAAVFDELVVGVLCNVAKKPLFSVEERIEMIKNAAAGITNVKIDTFDGLLVDFAGMHGAGYVVRGLRNVTDFDYELQMAQTNRILVPGIETVFFTTSLEYAYLSSSTVREVAAFGGDISRFVPKEIEERIKAKYK